MTPFRSEKNTNWEEAFRVPCLVRWPGNIKPGTVSNELMSHNDWIPTFCAIAGEPDVVGKLQKGYTANGINYKVHLDGYDQSAFLKAVSGPVGNNSKVKSARDKFFYADDDGMLVAFRQGEVSGVFDKNWVDPIIGVRGQWDFSDKWFFRYNGDIGGFGVSSDLNWQTFGGIGYNVNKLVSMAVGYRAIGVDYDRGGFAMDTISHGPVIGFEMHW